MIQAFCPSCRDQVELELVSLDSGSRCPRCGRSDLEPAAGGTIVSRAEFSHRLRTPLTVVKGSLQHLIKHWDELGDRDRKVLAKAVLAQAEIAITEVADIEDRMSAGEVRESAKPDHSHIGD